MLIELLKKLVEIPSASFEEHSLINFISDYLLRLDFTLDTVPVSSERANIVGTLGQAERYITFYAHLDTDAPQVSVLDSPFSLNIQGDELSGLGVSEMKAGIAAVLLICALAEKKGLPVKVIFTVGSRRNFDGAKRLLECQNLSDVDLVIVPRAGRSQSVHEPLSFCLGRSGRISYEVQLDGRTVHAVIQERGQNAVEYAAKFLAALREQEFNSDESLGKDVVTIDKVESHGDSFSIPSVAKLKISVLSATHDSDLAFEQWVTSYARENEIEIKLKKDSESLQSPYVVLPSSSASYQIIHSCMTALGVNPRFSRNAADENLLAEKLSAPVVSIGPIVKLGDSYSDVVSLSSLQATVEVFNRILELSASMEHTGSKAQAMNA